MGDMDKFCTIVVVVGAVLLLFMGFGEISRLNNFRRGSTTCGRSASIEDNSENDTSAAATSAKRSSNSLHMLAADKVKDTVGEYLGLTEQWPYDPSDDSKHKEMPQDEQALKMEFTWEANQDDDRKFEDLKVDVERIKKTANTKALSPDIMIEEPTHTKTLGLNNPLVDIWHGSFGKKDAVKFGKSCSWFGGTDAYFAARSKTASCDCLREDCDKCA